MMDNSDDIHLVSLPGAEETEPTTILEELNRNLIEPVVVAQAAANDANENEPGQNLNIDNVTNVTNVTNVGESNQLTDENQSKVTDEVNRDNNQISHSEKSCDSDRYGGVEILNFNLQTIDDAGTDEKPSRTETLDVVDDISEELKNCDEVLVSSSDLKSDNKSSPSSHASTGSLLREVSPPPVPLVTYRWEDVRRDKQKVRFEEGGYPWTYLEPHEPRVIVLNKDSQEKDQEDDQEDDQPKEQDELKLEGAKDLEEVELDRAEEETDFAEKLQFEIVPNVGNEPDKSIETKKQRSLPKFLKRALPSKKLDIQKANQSPTSDQLNSPTNSACCHPLVEKLKTMADKQLHKAKQYRSAKKHSLRDDERLDLSEHHILKLKESPKADRKEIASYVVKQDSDDVLDVITLDESPSEVRRHRDDVHSTIISPDEIIELPLSQDSANDDKKDVESIEPTATEILKTEVKRTPPQKSPRKLKEHVYEEIDQPPQNDTSEYDPAIQEFISRLSLRKEEDKVNESEDDVASSNPLPADDQKPLSTLLPPPSSIEPVSDGEKEPLAESQEESDQTIRDRKVSEKSDETKEPELKSSLKREASPCSDKKVTFSVSTDESDEPHREDVDLPEHVKINTKWSKMSDHEYEPIGESIDAAPIESASSQQDGNPQLSHDCKSDKQEDNSADAASITSHERKLLGATNAMDEEDLQRDRIEERFLAPTPQTDHSRNDEICTSQVDSSAIEDLPLRREDRKKSFMASTSDKTRNVQQKLRNQAGRLKSKLKEMQKPKQEDSADSSPKSERKRFRSPEFNKLKNIKMPKISKPEMKRPEFTKFKKPEFFKKYDGFSSLRLNRKKSNATDPSESVSGDSKITRTSDDGSIPTKKRFDFGTYPRIFDRMRRDNRSGGGGTTISRDTEPDEECDRVNVSGPILFSTVPRTKKDKKPVRSKWAPPASYADEENSSGKFKHYSLDRESSIEKRMRLDFKDSIDTEEEDGERGILQTEAQKQYADYDEENRAIHQISKAKEGQFRQRKPLVHQESDVVSEESSKDLGWVDTDHLRNRIMAHSGDLDISQKEEYVNEGLPDHLSTQETQSTGSSSNRRRKGVIEEIDDDEFFLRKKGISQDDIQIGKYISAAIREGLDTPVNALAQLAQYESYYDEDFDISNERVDYGYDVPPRKPRRVRDFEKSLGSSEFNDDSGMMPYTNEADHDEDLNVSPDGQFFQGYPPSRPRRKTRKQLSEESHDEHEVPVAAQYYPHPEDEDEHSFYENKHMEGIEQPDIQVTYNEDVKLDMDYAPKDGQLPPKAPKRRKHLLRESIERDLLANNFVGRSVSNSYLTNENAEETIVFRTEHEYVPQVQPEAFNTPTPTPRSRSKASPLTDDDRTSRGAESLAYDDTKPSTDSKEINGYAVVKKEPPPRPPAPIRRKRSTRSLGDRQFFTMPLRRNQNELVPERPVRNYSTIGPTRPIRPARRASLVSLEKPPSITSDATQYEEIEDINNLGNTDHHRDQKTDQNYKMKHRPLPPPPRPPRERKHRKSSESDGNKLDKDGSGEKITTKNVLEDISRISSQDMEEIEEMERSTQTDPLPDDYLCEEFDINSDMPIIEPSFSRHSKTLEDILKEEQQAEMERARQIADENSLTKGIHKFREANQRSLSERSRGSTDRPKTPSSRPITPSAVIIEKKNNLSTTETDAQLIVQPVDEDEVDTTTTTNITHRNRFFAEDTVDTEDERIVNEALKRYNLLDSDFRDSSPQHDIELNIREVEPSHQIIQTNEAAEIPLEAPPQAPPRRKSSCTESTVVPIANENEHVPIPEEDRTDIESHNAAVNLLPGNRLHVNELEVEHLNVHDLQAGRILVSDLQAIALSSQDIECTAGDLTVKGIKLPPGFLEDLINRARTTIDEHVPAHERHETLSQLTHEPNDQQTSNIVPQTEHPVPADETSQEPEPPARPPPPRSLYPSDYAPYSLPPPSFYQLRSYPDEIEEVLPHSPTMHRQRRRYHRRRDSTSEEEEQREHRRSRQHSNRSPEPSIGDLSGQLMRACGSAIGRGGVKLYALMKEKNQEMKRRDVSIGVAILIFVVAFLMMIGIRGERTVHHHHWDYWNPPGSSGRP